MTIANAPAPIRPRQAAAAGLQAVLFLAYPFVIYFAHTRLAARAVGGLILALYALPLLVSLRRNPAELRQVALQHLPLAGLIAAAIALDDRRLLLLLPTLVSAYLFGTFAWSLQRGTPMIERFARMAEDDLPDFTLPYCRSTTLLWSVFLALNAATAAALALRAPLAWWVLYTGPGFYLLLGLLLGGEYCFRKWWFRYYGDGAADRVLARLFPPEHTARGRRSLAYVERRRSAAASPQ
jgi:uncharacterized membrane protein